MSMILRPYQQKLKSDIYASWEKHNNVAAILPTGGGKTAIFSSIIADANSPSCSIAHRQELVGQISLALAKNHVHHSIIAPPKVVKLCSALHREKVGRSYYDPRSVKSVAGVDTLIRRKTELSTWAKTVRVWVMDEGHHLLADNKWGRAASMFPGARGLSMTATFLRADGKGLGRDYDGLIEGIVEGPDMRWLINQGYLTDYRIFCPPSDYKRPDNTKLGSDGDFTIKANKEAVKRSTITGDIVKSYIKFAYGKRGVTFAPDIETAEGFASAFLDSGIPAAAVHSKLPHEERVRLLREFEAGRIWQLVNVDMFGEGYDLPAIECVSMARATESFGLYCQQFGRALRLMKGKLYAIIIDHVGNVARHGLPDAKRKWTLKRRDRKQKSNAEKPIPMWVCGVCAASWPVLFKTCQDVNCGCPKPLPESRASPEFVDGDLVELDHEALRRLRGDVALVDKDPEVYRAELAAKRVPLAGQFANVKRHTERQSAQAELRHALSWWGGYQRSLNRSDSESYILFNYTFGVDVLSAQALGTKEAIDLKNRIYEELADAKITEFMGNEMGFA